MARKWICGLLVFALCVAMMGAPAARAGEFEDAKKELITVMKYGVLSEQVAAIERVATFNNKEAVGLLFDFYMAMQQLISQAKDLSKVQEQFEAQDVVAQALREQCIGEEAIEAVIKNLKGNWPEQALVGRAMTKEYESRIDDIVKDCGKVKDPNAMLDVIRGLGRVGSDKGVDAIGEMLKKNPVWNVRDAATEAFEKIGSMKALPHLISIYQDEAESLQVRENAYKLMVDLTGEDFKSNYSMWSDWYKKNESAIKAGTMARGDKQFGGDSDNSTAVVKYYGIEVKAKRIVFVIDRSGSMMEPYTPAPGAQQDDDEDAPATGDDDDGGGGVKKEEKRKPRGSTKWEVAQNELIDTINALEENASFTIIAFSDSFIVWQDQMMRATKEVKAKAVEWVNKLSADGMTNIYDPMERALEIANGGKGAGAGAVTGGKFVGALVDSIFLMSDGAPNSGKIPEANAILQAVDNLNRNLRITIHTIGIGNHDPMFMRAMAEQNNGTYVAR